MSTMMDYFRSVRTAFGPNLYYDFVIAHARDYSIGPETYEGPRGTPQNCYGNATDIALWNDDLTYVEGKVTCHGVPIDHAWCVDADGIVYDNTIKNDGRIDNYCGVPFKREYVKRAVIINGFYSLLDPILAHKTALKLFELGLEAGQQWLLDQPEVAKRKRRVRA